MPGDLGSQTVHIKFYDELINSAGNFIGLDVRKPGIYSGGYLTKVSDTSVSLSTLSCEIPDSVGTGNQVRVTTGSAVTITVAVATPLVVLRWTYTGSSTLDYMDFVAVAVGAQSSTDVVVGLCSYTGSTLSGFTYTLRTTPNVMDLFLKVEPTSPASMYVRIRAGRVNYGTTTYTIVDQLSPVFTAPTSGSRIDLLQVNTSGTIIITPGIAGTSPTAPDYGGLITLAEVTIASGASSLASSNITDVRGFVGGNSPSYPVVVAKGGTGSTTASGARTNLGLGTLATQDASAVAITGGSVTGITDLALADGGTGSSTAAGAWNNIGKFGSWTTKVGNTTYQAETDGFVIGYLGQNGIIYGYTDSSNPPTTKRWGQTPQDGYSTTSSIFMLVRKGDYWKVTTSVGSVTLFWISLGN